MKKTSYLFGFIFLLLSTSCTEDEEQLTECETVRKQRYSDIEASNFTINSSTNLFQNYGHQTFPEKKRDQLHPFAQLWEFTNVAGTSATCKLHFTRIGFDEDDCNPKIQHQIHVQAYIDQKPFETNTYPINSTLQSAFASYGGELLNESEILRFSQDNAGSLTITKYIPDTDIEGHYSININGIMVSGNFDYDLTRSY